MPATLSARPARRPAFAIGIRNAERADIDALVALEHRVFASDRLSRRSLRRFLQVESADVIVAEWGGRLAGTAIVLFRRRSAVARLYSIAVAPSSSGQGVGALLLQAAERSAAARGCRSIRLEVHVGNHAAIARYRKSGYTQFDRKLRYYEDGGDALRFQKPLARLPFPSSRRRPA